MWPKIRENDGNCRPLPPSPPAHVSLFIECVFKLVLSNFGDLKEANKTCTSRACPHVCSIIRMWDLISSTFLFSVDSVRLETLHVHFYRPKTQFVGNRNNLRPFVELSRWQRERVSAWAGECVNSTFAAEKRLFPDFCASFQLFSSLNVRHSCWALILAVSSGFALANLRVSGRQTQIFRAVSARECLGDLWTFYALKSVNGTGRGRVLFSSPEQKKEL